MLEAYRKALACDTTSAFGGIVALNRKLDAEAAKAITEIFTEVIIAPEATDEAIKIVAAKKNLRLLVAGGLPDPRAKGLTVKSVAGGLLVQSRDNAVVDEMQLKTVTKRAPSEAELADLRFAFRVAKHVKSNTIVYAKDRATVGIGAGQMSRVDAARIAARKAEDAAKELKLPAPLTKGSVVASDAFFPFPDGLLVAIEAGATAVIQPGGSMRDDEVIAAADAAQHRDGVHRHAPFQALAYLRDGSVFRQIAQQARRDRQLGQREPRTRRFRGSPSGCARLRPGADEPIPRPRRHRRGRCRPWRRSAGVRHRRLNRARDRAPADRNNRTRRYSAPRW